LAQEVVASAEAAMTGLLAEHEHADLAVETHVIEGSAGARLVEFAAQRGADLLVMGTHGRTGLDRLVAGSVAERVVRSSLVPVWVVRAASGTV
jgi:nucleotide-binding universal stress UspA family protein